MCTVKSVSVICDVLFLIHGTTQNSISILCIVSKREIHEYCGNVL